VDGWGGGGGRSRRRHGDLEVEIRTSTPHTVGPHDRTRTGKELAPTDERTTPSISGASRCGESTSTVVVVEASTTRRCRGAHERASARRTVIGSCNSEHFAQRSGQEASHATSRQIEPRGFFFSPSRGRTRKKPGPERRASSRKAEQERLVVGLRLARKADDERRTETRRRACCARDAEMTAQKRSPLPQRFMTRKKTGGRVMQTKRSK